MPYEIVPNHPNCPSNRPFGVVKQGGTRRMGCHSTQREARSQLRALYASEKPTTNDKGFGEVGYMEINLMRDGRTRELNERFLVMAANLVSNGNIRDPIGGLHVLVDEYLERLNDWQAG